MPLKIGGWTLLFHDAFIAQLSSLAAAYLKAKRGDPSGFRANANTRALAAIAKLVIEVVPSDPGRQEYRIGNTMGPDYRHWSRVKFGGRFRLFFRYDSKSRIIVFAWVNDSETLRKSGSNTDPYTVFKAMLKRNDPPDDWAALRAKAADLPDDLRATLAQMSND